MKRLVLFTLVGMVLFSQSLAAEPQAPGKETPVIDASQTKHPGHPGGHGVPPRDIVLFGLSRNGEETKPFLLSIPPLPPMPHGGPVTPPPEAPKGELKERQDEGSGAPPKPPVQRGFLGINGQGHILSNVELKFSDREKQPNAPAQLESVKATILDIAPPAVSREEMEKQSDEERAAAVSELEEQMKSAKEAGTLEIAFAMRNDLKSPGMTDIEILAGEGKASVNGEEFALLFLSPPPPPRPEHGKGPDPRGPGGDNAPSSPLINEGR